MNLKNKLILTVSFLQFCFYLSAQTIQNLDSIRGIDPNEFFVKFKNRIDEKNKQIEANKLNGGAAFSSSLKINQPLSSSLVVNKPLKPIDIFDPGTPIKPTDPILPIDSTTAVFVDPDVPIINTGSKVVGEIISKAQVTKIGSSSVSVSFEEYSDPRNFAPQMGLAYNSMSGSSPYGYGWGVSGMSVISRSNRALYYDNEVSAPNLNMNDAFTLDGKKLIEISRTNSIIYYKTEADNIKVTANLSDENITSFFVYYTNGDKATYDINDGNNYYVSMSTDKLGNTIKYTYTLCTGHYRLASVSYGASGKAIIDFKYTDDNSNTADIIFKNGKQIKYNYYLSEVQTKYNGVPLKTYKFAYAIKENRRILVKIQCSNGNEEVEPIVFDYNEDNTIKRFVKNESQLMSWLKFDKSSDLSALCAKISYGSDNDGIVMYQTKNPYLEFYQHSSFWRHSKHYMQNQYNGDENILLATDIENSIALGYDMKTEAGFIDLFTCDLDGFQDDEIVKVNQNIVNNNEEIKFSVYRQSFAGIGKKYERTYSLANLVDGNLQPKYFYSGDFNGDGKTEIMMVTSSEFYDQNIGTKCVILDLENNKILYNGSPFTFYNRIPRSGDPDISSEDAYNRSDKLFPADFDGDGKTDICIVKDDGTYYYTFNGPSSLSCFQLAKTTSLQKSDFTDRTFGAGDFNGDGNIDIIISPTKNNGSVWKIFASTGHYNFNPYTINLTARGDDDVFAYQDIDLDGQTDLVLRNKDKLYAYYIQNFANRGYSFTDIKDNTNLVQTDVKERNKWYSMLSIQNDGKIVKLNLERDVLKNLEMTKFTNSFGLQTKFEYGWLNDTGEQFYQKGYGASYPFENFQGRLSVCKSIETVANSQSVSRVNYFYYDAIIHRQGLGFRGFSRISSYDDIQNCSTIEVYDPYNFSNLLSEDNYKKKINYTYSTSVDKNKLVTNILSKKEFTDKTNGVKSTTEYTYDAFGSMTKADETFSDGSESVLKHEYKNVIDETHNIIGLLTNESKTTITSEGEEGEESKEYGYNSNNMVVSEKTKINGNIILTTSYEYDNNLNVSKKSLKYFSSPNEDNETYVTNDLGQLISKTDKYGLTQKFTYDYYGRLASIVDARNNCTQYKYDEWGNLFSTINSDGTTSKSSAIFSTLKDIDALYYTEVIATNKPIVRTYYNIFGNVVRKSEQCYDGVFVNTDFVFDNRNRISKQSLPYRSSCNGWKTTSYDEYDRPIKITYPSGKVDVSSYSGLSVTNTVDGVTTTKTVDCFGNLINTISPTGTTKYHYDGLDNLISILAPGNIETKIEYDKFGRKTKLNDLSSGTTTYEYNTEGQIFRKTDARGYSTVYYYDAFNRPIEKTLVHEGKSATFKYDNYGNMIYQEESNGTSKSFEYNELNLLVSKTHIGLDGNWIKTTYQYDNGNITNVDYTSNRGKLASENYSYTNGTLVQIKLNN